MNASPELQEARRKLEAESSIDQLTDSTNSLHREHPRGPFVTVKFCQDHHFESHVLPVARASRWPTEIDFSGLYNRLGVIIPPILEYLKSAEDSPYYWLARGEYDHIEDDIAAVLDIQGHLSPSFGVG